MTGASFYYYKEQIVFHLINKIVFPNDEDSLSCIRKNYFEIIDIIRSVKQDASHQHADEELLKRKVQSIIDCYLESCTPPALQVRKYKKSISFRVIRIWSRNLTSKHLPAKLIKSSRLVFCRLTTFKTVLRVL